MQLKARIDNRAKAANVSPQLMLQNYLLERLIERISLSGWRDCVIVKGGMLIGSLIGVDRRTTKDLDTTIRGFTLSHEMARKVFCEVCVVEIDDDLKFELLRTEDIRETDEYPDIRVFLKACYAPLAVPVTVMKNNSYLGKRCKVGISPLHDVRHVGRIASLGGAPPNVKTSCTSCLPSPAP